MPTDDTIRKYEKTLTADEDVETTFQRLRRDGHSRKEAVQVLLALLDCSLSEAKRVLATNPTWAEARDAAPDDGGEASPPVPPAPG
jgi:hypothetical protein